MPTTLPVCLSFWLFLIFVLSLFNTAAEIYGIDSSSTENETSVVVGPQFPIDILYGASVQGNPAFDPITLTVIPGSTIEVVNLDTVPHTVTSGKGPSDNKSGNVFDTGIIDAGDISFIRTSSSNLGVGDYPFYCSIHPFMKGRLVVVNEIDTTSSFTSSSLAQGTTVQEQQEPPFVGPPISTQMTPQQLPQLRTPQSFFPSITAPTFPPPIQPNPFIILSQSSYIDNIGSLHIVGEVQNLSYETAEFVKVTATFYNSINQVVGTDFGYTDPHDLVSGQRAPFDLIVMEGSMPSYNIAYYTLNVDSS